MNELLEQMNKMMASGLMTENEIRKFMDKMTGGKYLTPEQKEELEWMVSEKSRLLDDLLTLGIFTEGQIQRGKSKLRKACLAQIKNNELGEEE
tara:strand:- start:470 stop:748 length:279 start_codon:yes stop_codon:yes gene_type:complete